MEWWQVQEVMITGATIVGVLVPVLALTYRFVLKPSTGRKGRLEAEREASISVRHEARLDSMERQLEDIEVSVRRLAEASEFDRQLKAGQPPEAEG